MYLKYVQIVNYKNLTNARFEFGKGANTVIGENDSGKSNAMTAMRILLDDDYFYNTKRLKESDFSEKLGDWRGHWIIISAFFDGITQEDQQSEVSVQIAPEKEDEQFLKSFIRCEGYNYGVVTLFIRPNKQNRRALYEADSKEEFERVRGNLSLSDYEFFYTARSQADFTNPRIYKSIVGDFNTGEVTDPDNDDSSIIGTKVDITEIWKHISLEFIDALRDAQTELRKPKNPLRRIFDVVHHDVETDTIESIREKIRELNTALSEIPQVKNIGTDVNKKLNDIVGLVYSPEICIESHIREEIESIARNLTIVPANEEDIELLGLGHLNILYIALKLVEFEVNRNHEILNIMIVEEPEAHIHTHIQRTLFENLNVREQYTQVIMTTHSTHLSEVANISKMNVLKRNGNQAIVMRPTTGLKEYGKNVLKMSNVSIEKCIERYLDAKRSVLLFSKAVILVEGDGEELLIPALVKKCLGVTLDELGIGLINVGSVAFEYIASIFSEERIQRHCAIITDLDTVVEGAEKSSDRAEKLGRSRKKKLNVAFKGNKWVKLFYAPHTLEVDFYNLDGNRKFLNEIISDHYSQKSTIEKHILNISDSESKRYDSVITVINELGKGWHSVILAEKMDNTVQIPEYILDALVFAAQEVLTPQVFKRIAMYVAGCYENGEKYRDNLNNAVDDIAVMKIIDEVCKKYKDDDFAILVKLWKEKNSYD